VAHIAHIAGDDDELVPADAPHEIAGPLVGQQPVTHGDEQLVADAVTKRVVDQLEAVDVEEQQRDLGGLPGVAERAGEMLLHQPAVGQIGEPVMGGLMGEAGLGPG